MTGDFEQARALTAEGNAILGELGRMESAVSHHEALVELLAGRARRAERGCARATRRSSAWAARRCSRRRRRCSRRRVYEQGRVEEAEALCESSERCAAAEDLVTQVMWRGVRARVLARRGARPEAEALAREAVALVEPTDSLTDQRRRAARPRARSAAGWRPRPRSPPQAGHSSCTSRKGAVVLADRARSARPPLRTAQVDGGDHAEIAVR